MVEKQWWYMPHLASAARRSYFLPIFYPQSGEKRRCEAWDNQLRAQEACADGLAYTPPGHGGVGERRLAAACKAAIGKRMRGR